MVLGELPLVVAALGVPVLELLLLQAAQGSLLGGQLLAPAFTFSLELLQLFVGHKKVGIANSLEILGKDEQQTFQHCCESGIIYSGSGTSSDI